MMVYVSTGYIRNMSAAQYALSLYSSGIKNIELSGGGHSDDYLSELRQLPSDLEFQIHNYYPPPSKPFVLNLASGDSEIARRSIAHIKTAMQVVREFKLSSYSLHAGFLIDPSPSSLGGILESSCIMSRDEGLSNFFSNIELCLNDLPDGSVLLIENNVLNKKTLHHYGTNPLLLVDPYEIIEFLSKLPSNVRLLLDVAHLKVSASTLGFDLHEAHKLLTPFIGAYHLSENDGSVDSNDKVMETSWFWEGLVPDLAHYTLEVYNTPHVDLVSQVELSKRKIQALC